MKKYHIYSLGHALVDVTYQISDQVFDSLSLNKGHRKLLSFEEKNALLAHIAEHCEPVDRTSGGSGANSIVAAAAMGADCFFSCKVGKDDAGAFFLDALHHSNVDTLYQTPAHEGDTGLCIVLVTEDAERTMNTFTGITDDLGVDVIDFDILANASILYLESYLTTTKSAQYGALKAIQHARASDTQIVVNFSDPAMVKFFKEQLVQWFDQPIDLLFCNDEEAQIWGNGDVDEGISQLSELTKVLVVTKGELGSTIYQDQKTIDIAAYPVTPLNTSGAGDIFAGAFLYGYCQNYPLDVCGDLASYASSLLVQQNRPRLSIEELNQARDKVLNP